MILPPWLGENVQKAPICAHSAHISHRRRAAFVLQSLPRQHSPTTPITHGATSGSTPRPVPSTTKPQLAAQPRARPPFPPCKSVTCAMRNHPCKSDAHLLPSPFANSSPAHIAVPAPTALRICRSPSPSPPLQI